MADQDVVNQQGLDEGLPTQDDNPFARLAEMNVRSYIADDQPPPAPEPVAKPVEDDRYQKLEQELQALRENQRQQHANWNQEHMKRRQAEDFVEALRRVRWEEQQAAQQAAQYAPPKVDVDWEDVVDDPRKLGAAVNQVAQTYAEYGRNQAMGMSHPFINKVQQYESIMAPILSSAKEFMLDRADKILREKHGVTDFDEYRDRIRQSIDQGGFDAFRMLENPDNIVSVYGAMAIGDGKPFNTRERTDPPISVGGNPPYRPSSSDKSQTPPELQNLWSKMAGSFPGVPAPSEKELEEMGIDWKTR